MEVRDGYKMTEVGVIPVDWEVVEQKDVVKYINGRAFSIYEWEDIGVPVVRLQNLTQHGGDFYYTNLSLPDKQYMDKGDLIYMWSASFGPYIWWGSKAVFHYHIWKIECKPEADKGFYYQKLLEITEQLKTQTSGSTMMHLTKSGMEKYKIAIPPTKTEQRRIAAALGDVDGWIRALEALLAKKRLVKAGVSGELLRPGVGWREVRLGEVLSQTILGGNYRNKPVKGPLPLIKMGNIGRGSMQFDVNYSINPNVVVEHQHMLKKGDVLFNTRNTLDLVGKVAIWRGEQPVAYYNSNLLRLVFDEDFVSSNEFMNYLLNTRRVINRFRAIATGTTSVAAIYTRDLQEISLKLPPLNDQTQIAQTLSTLDAELSALEAKLAKARVLKAGMMGDLLTGRVRLA